MDCACEGNLHRVSCGSKIARLCTKSQQPSGNAHCEMHVVLATLGAWISNSDMLGESKRMAAQRELKQHQHSVPIPFYVVHALSFEALRPLRSMLCVIVQTSEQKHDNFPHLRLMQLQLRSHWKAYGLLVASLSAQLVSSTITRRYTPKLGQELVPVPIAVWHATLCERLALVLVRFKRKVPAPPPRETQCAP